VVQFFFIVSVLLKIFDNFCRSTTFATLFWRNRFKQDFKKALHLASVCEHPNAIWLTKLFVGHDVSSWEHVTQVFLGCGNVDARALCFAGLFGGADGQISRAAELGDAFAQAEMAGKAVGENDVSLFDGRKNLVLKKNAMVSTGLDIVIDMDVDARKTWKGQRRTI
jgi:hypothetical protein